VDGFQRKTLADIIMYASLKKIGLAASKELLIQICNTLYFKIKSHDSFLKHPMLYYNNTVGGIIILFKFATRALVGYHEPAITNL